MARALASLRQCVLFQETKIHHARQMAGLHVHLHNEIGHNNYKILINDHRQDLDSSPGNRSNGVAVYFHASMPGFKELRHVHELDVPDRYIVVATTWEDVQVFFHNVYAPVLAPQRPAFFASLPRHFPTGAILIVGGDFNLPMVVNLDAPRTTKARSSASSGSWRSVSSTLGAGTTRRTGCCPDPRPRHAWTTSLPTPA